MNISNLTIGQKKALLKSLESQKSPMTKSEKIALNALRFDLSEEITAEEGRFTLLRVGNLVRMIDIDTFGEDYRIRWVKVKENRKGEFFNIQYLSGSRIFID